MPIPAYSRWIEDTKLGVLRPRSSQLKAVDEAIQQYERAKTQENLFKIKNAFEAWKRSKGTAWKTSDRNGKHAITNLDVELSKVDYRIHQITTFTMEELKALAFMGEERKKVLVKVFSGKEVTFRDSPRAMKEVVKEKTEDVRAACGKAKSWLEGNRKSSGGMSTSEKVREKFDQMVKDIFSVDSIEKLGSLSGFVLDILGECAVSIPPVVGHIKDGYDLFTGWAKAAKAGYTQYSVSDRHYIIETGAPAAAFEGVKTCLREETRNQITSASIATTSFALKTGLAALDGGVISGPVVGAANAVASLTQSLYLLAVEYRATVAINQQLTNGNLDITIFRTYPLMGCYLMTSATFSDLIPIDCFGTPGWVDYVEGMKKRQFDGVYKAATDLIDGSPWEIRGLPKRPTHGAGLQMGMLSTAKDFASNVKGIFS